MKTTILVLILLLQIQSFAQIPILNSKPNANAVIFLDFDGQTVTSTIWNNGNTIFCQSPNVTPELVTNTFNIVAEDYKIFKINVTTDSAVFLAAPLTQRIRIIITPTNFFGGAGIAYLNSFVSGDDTPAFVFCDPNPNAKFMGEASSHEAGHSLGCAHQSIYDIFCDKTAEYNGGQGSSEIGWAPIMGYSVDRFFSTWHNGKGSLSCDVQDDISIIASRITGGGLETDDIANTINSSASTLNIVNNQVNASGIINSSTDVDVFKITLPLQSRINVVTQFPFTNSSNYGNLDILVKLYNATGVLISQFQYTDSLKARVDTILSAGLWYLAIEGIANQNSITDYGSIGSYRITGAVTNTSILPFTNIALFAKEANDVHAINWNIVSDENIQQKELEFSTDGRGFIKLTTIHHNTDYYSWTTTSSIIFYRIKTVLQTGEERFSKVISVKKGASTIKIISKTAEGIIHIRNTEKLTYALYDSKGKQIQSGHLPLGIHQLGINAASGIYVLKMFTDKETIVERVSKLKK